MSKRTEKILNATIRLFLENGIRKITMDDIAANCGTSKVTVYRYFADKDTLYSETSRHIYSGYTLRLESILASGDPLKKKLCDYLDAVSDFTDSGQFALCAELARDNEGSESARKQYLQTYKHSLQTLIDAGIQGGLIKDSPDRQMIFDYIDMGMVYYQQNAEYRRKMQSDPDYRRRFLLFYIGNIFADGTDMVSPS